MLTSIRWVYIIEGIFSVLVAFVVWFGLPNDPSNAYFLNAEEKEMMRVRAIQRQAYMGSEEFDWNEVKLALKDPKVYLRYIRQASFGSTRVLTDSAVALFSSVKISCFTALAPSFRLSSREWVTTPFNLSI